MLFGSSHSEDFSDVNVSKKKSAALLGMNTYSDIFQGLYQNYSWVISLDTF